MGLMNNRGRLEVLLDVLGVTTTEFEMESGKFALSPARWLQEKILKLGYVQKSGDGQ